MSFLGVKEEAVRADVFDRGVYTFHALGRRSFIEDNPKLYNK